MVIISPNPSLVASGNPQMCLMIGGTVSLASSYAIPSIFIPLLKEISHCLFGHLRVAASSRTSHAFHTVSGSMKRDQLKA